MQLSGKKILLTGAAGGIGNQLTHALLRQGCILLVTDHSQSSLDDLFKTVERNPQQLHTMATDLLDSNAPDRLVAHAHQILGSVDVLINLAGLMSFTLFHQEDLRHLDNLWRVNTIVPMHLARLLLPGMIERGNGKIVNIGSVYGSIAFPGFATYSATKFALRGFSESLRRELEGTGVGVTYVGPRYVKTPINDGAVQRMSAALNVNMDEPGPVAEFILRAILADRHEQFIGFPESLFVRINGAFPGLVDGSIRKQVGIIREFAAGKK